MDAQSLKAEMVIALREANARQVGEAVGEWLDDVAWRSIMSGMHPDQVLMADWQRAHYGR